MLSLPSRPLGWLRRRTPVEAPADFVAFVADQAAGARRAAVAATGDERAADELIRSAFTAAALRWRVSAAAPDDRPVRLLADVDREVDAWRRDRPAAVDQPARTPVPQGFSLPGAGTGWTAEDVWATSRHAGTTVHVRPLAEAAWARARGIRRRRWLSAGVALVLLAGIGGAAHVYSTRRAPPPAPVAGPIRPTALDLRLDLVPPVAAMATLPRQPTVMPRQITLTGPGAATTGLRERPVHRALAVFLVAGPQLLVLGDDGGLRSLAGMDFSPSNADATFAALTPTSLSPDGTRVAFPRLDAVLVADVRDGAVRTYAVQGPNQGVVWTGPDALLVIQGARSVALRLGTGAVETSPLDGRQVATDQSADRLLQLTPRLGGGNGEISLWSAGRADRRAPIERRSLPLSWVGDFYGPGWLWGGLVARDCGTADLMLPLYAGQPVSATVVVDILDGLVRRALVATQEGAASKPPALLGWLDAHTLLIKAGDRDRHYLLAWDMSHSGDVRFVAQISDDVPMSVALGG